MKEKIMGDMALMAPKLIPVFLHRYIASFRCTNPPVFPIYGTDIIYFANNLIDKTFNQLDLFDVTRMLIQKMFLELAVLKAISFIKENPFCGQRYEGELLEILCKLDRCCLKKYMVELEEILRDALNKNKEYDWLCEDERKEFSDLISSFFKSFKQSKILLYSNVIIFLPDIRGKME